MNNKYSINDEKLKSKSVISLDTAKRLDGEHVKYARHIIAIQPLRAFKFRLSLHTAYLKTSITYECWLLRGD